MRTRMLGRWLVVIGMQLSVCCRATIAAADESADVARDQARNLGYEGIDAYEAGRLGEAETKLAAAYRLLTVPSLGLWWARALARMGKRAEAEQRYREVLTLPLDTGDVAVQRAAQRDAERELQALQARPATPPVVGEHADAAFWRPYAYPAWAFGALGFGGLVLAGALGRADQRALADDCPSATEVPALVGPGVCSKAQADSRKDDYERAFLLADAGLVAGLLGAAAGSLVFVTTRQENGSGRSERLAAGLSLGTIGLASVTSSLALGLSARRNKNILERCEPNCSEGRVDAVDTRSTAAAVSLGVGLLAIGGATWVLLAGSQDAESPGASVAFGATREGGTLSVSQPF